VNYDELFASTAGGSSSDGFGALGATSFLSTLESLSDGFWQLDPQWRVVYVNGAACRVVGQSRDELVGRILWQAFPALVGTRVETAYHHAVADRVTVEFEHYYEPLARWFGIKASPTPEGGLAIVSRDITEGKRSEAVLRAAHDTFRHLVENSPFGVYVVDSDFRLVQVSVGARKAFENVDPLLGRDFAEVLRVVWPEPFAAEAIGRFRHTLETGEMYRAPSTVERRLDIGEVQSYDWKIERLMLPDGRPGVVCHFYDLSERQRLEAELSESEWRFRLASEAARAMVYDVDLTGRRPIICHGLERVTGYDAAEIGPTLEWWFSIIHPDDLVDHRPRVMALVEAGHPYTAVYRIRHKDGMWIWVEATTHVVKDRSGAATQVIGTLLDITSRRHALDALRESEQRFRTLHALSSRLMSARDLTRALGDVLDNAISSCGGALGSVQLYNPQSETLEVVVQRGIGRSVLDHFVRKGRVEQGSPCARVLERGECLAIEDVALDAEFAPHRRVAADAGFRAVHATPLKAHDGTIVGILSVCFRQPGPVTEADQQLLDLHARHAADLIMRLHYEEVLHDAERRKDEFLAILAHELRNPLAPLATSLELIKRARGDTSLLSRALATMQRQVEHMVRLVDDLMDVSRIKTGKLEVRMERLDLASIVQHAVEACQPLLERHRHTLRLVLPAAPVHLRADPVRLAQVFCNLITNSCKYSEPGGHIQLGAERDGATVRVSVTDAGCGIPADRLPQVFDLFMQDGRTREKSGGGLGIGLPLVKRLVEMHGGTVTARSEGIGRGSTFTVSLPVSADSA
jgi:PAS domain S-box-containing protein